MKIEDATNIYIGTSSASAVYLGTNKVWPLAPTVPTNFEVNYAQGPNAIGGWGNIISNGSNNSLDGIYSFAAFINGSNYTSQYNWLISGDITLHSISYISDNPNTTIKCYNYTIGSSAGTLSLKDPGTNRTLFSASFNVSQQQVQHEFLQPTTGDNFVGDYDSNNDVGYWTWLSVGSAADNYSTNVLNDTNYTNLITITNDTGGCVSLDLMDDGNGHYEPYIVISAGSGTCTLTYDDGINTCSCTFDYSITDVASQSAGDMTSVQITDMASDNGLSSGQTMQYEEEWHGDSQRFIIRNKSTAGTGVAYYHTNTGDQLRIYGSAIVEFEYDTHTITKIVMNCIAANYVGNIGTLTTSSGSVTQDDVNYTVTWEGSATTVQIQNTGSRQIRLTSIDIYYV